MPANIELNLPESIELFHARLKNIEHFLSATFPGFNADIEEQVTILVNESTLPASSKTKMVNYIKEFRNTLPKHK